MDKIISYFAYGSNLDLEHLSALKVPVRRLKRAVLKDYQLVFNVLNSSKVGAGYANIAFRKGAITEGLIIYTDKVAIKYLDEYEGFPILYKRKHLSVFDKTKQEEKVMVYMGSEKMLSDNLKPTEAHLKQILNGKKFFSAAYFEKIKAIVPI